MGEDSWKRQVTNCLGLSVSMHPSDGSGVKTAKSICFGTFTNPSRDDLGELGGEPIGDCPVRHACVASAISHHENFGVWGGLSERERRRLRRRAGINTEKAIHYAIEESDRQLERFTQALRSSSSGPGQGRVGAYWPAHPVFGAEPDSEYEEAGLYPSE